MRLIGLTGKAGAGKDTVAEMIDDHFGDQGYIHSFAEPLREMADIVVKMLTGDYIDWDNRAVKERTIDIIGKSPRQLLQTLGTEWGRQLVHTDLWVLCAATTYRSAQKLCRNMPVFVLPDARFENEAAWIRAEGGEVWHIIRPNTAEVGIPGHASEAGVEIKPGDTVIHNDGDIALLHDEVALALRGELKV